MDYFEDTEYISNSQLRNFVKYSKYWERLLTPDIYKAFHIDKTAKFKMTDAVIVWKIVDRYFDGEWEAVWNYYEMKARRSAEDKKNDKIISSAVQESALTMIEWWNNWTKFQDFINDKDTKAQTELRQEFELTDTTWEIIKVKFKWLPDFYNSKKKLIVDLKTTGNLDMVIDDLQFKWEPKFTANYLRQLAWYNKLLWGWYDWALAVITEKWVKWIEVPNWILVEVEKQLDYDLIECTKYIDNPNEIDESIFKEEELSI